MAWPFSRRAAAVASASAPESWHVGDLGECIADRWRYLCPHNPKRGDVIRVTSLIYHDDALYLGIESAPNDHHYESRAFRRIVVDHVPAEADFALLIKRHATAPDAPAEA